jgi:hypothetical protein
VPTRRQRPESASQPATPDTRRQLRQLPGRGHPHPTLVPSRRIRVPGIEPSNTPTRRAESGGKSRGKPPVRRPYPAIWAAKAQSFIRPYVPLWAGPKLRPSCGVETVCQSGCRIITETVSVRRCDREVPWQAAKPPGMVGGSFANQADRLKGIRCNDYCDEAFSCSQHLPCS